MNILDATKSLEILLDNPQRYSTKLAEQRGVPITVFLSEVAVVLKFLIIEVDNDQRLRNLLVEKLDEIQVEAEKL